MFLPTSRGRGGLLLSKQSGPPRSRGCLTKHAAARHGPTRSASLPARDVVLAAELLHALVLVLLHAGDALVPGADLLGLAGLHHGVRAGGGHELGVPRPLLGSYWSRTKRRAEVCWRRPEGVGRSCCSSTETEGGILLLLLLLLVSSSKERGLVPSACTEETTRSSKPCSSRGRGCKYQY